MAIKKYAYYNKGNKFAIVESELTGGGSRNLAVAHCTVGSHTNKADCEAAGGQWIPSSGGTDLGATEKYVSPRESITDGIEVEYSYVPTYRINETDAGSDTIDINSFTETSGKVRLTLDSSVSFTKGDSIVISGYNKLNGLHTVLADTSSSTNLSLDTNYNGSVTTFTSNKPFIYTNVTSLSDEDFELDLTDYQSQAVVYYMKAKMFEDMRDVEGREYFMRLFKKQIEKASGAKKRGPNIIQGFSVMKNY